jgi:hypothetical protein
MRVWRERWIRIQKIIAACEGGRNDEDESLVRALDGLLKKLRS